MKDQQDHRPRRSRATWLARNAAIPLSPTRTSAPVGAIACAKTSLDLTFLTGAAA